jgi:sec-independent protein translocase protein TatA
MGAWFQGLKESVMGSFSIWHILILAVVALVLFGGRGKISDLMGDFGKGVNSFKKGLNEGAKEDPKVINGEARPTEATTKDKDKTAA